MQGDKSAVHSSLTSTASIVQDLADAGIRVKPGYVIGCSAFAFLHSVLRRDCIIDCIVDTISGP